MASNRDENVMDGMDIMKQAEAGVASLKKEKALDGDMDAAKKFKDEIDDMIAALSTTDQYIDATHVLKGQPPQSGHFLKAGQEVKSEPEKPKPAAAPAAEAADNGAKKDGPRSRSPVARGLKQAVASPGGGGASSSRTVVEPMLAGEDPEMRPLFLELEALLDKLT